MAGDDYILSERKVPVILIVDDTNITREVMAKILSKEGYRIETAMNGRQALDIAGKVYPDLVLLDVVMPEMDGYEVCRILKESPETKDIPIIFITVKNEMEDIVKGFEAGAVDYVTKPFNSVELLVRVRTHLELKRKRDNEKVLICRLKATLSERKRTEEEREKLIVELREALSKIKTLSGMLPICSSCKKIRDDRGYWNQIESYIMCHSEAEFSHSICPECAKILYPEYCKNIYPEGDE